MADILTPLRFPLMALLLMMAGCATTTQQQDDRVTACRALFEQVDSAVEQHQVRDQGPALIEDFPYLRVTRLLASFGDEVATPERFTAWSRHLATLDAQARRFELRNLDTPVAGMDDEVLLDELDRCREQLMLTELAQPGIQQRLRTTAHVPDDYLTWWRVAGLYPLTAPLVLSGISRWHAETHGAFATPLQELPVQGNLTRWSTPPATPLDGEQIRTLLDTERDTLGLPLPNAAALQQLFDTFAPVWEVDVASEDDRIGAPVWRNGPAVDTGQPVLYRLASHTRFDGMLLLQLNYIVWFPARPGDDIYAGQLDGINWRVTLGPDGTPWMYDLIHNCGCYYQFLSTRHLRLRKDLYTPYFEMPLHVQAAPEGHPLILRIAATTHFLQRVYPLSPPSQTVPLLWRDYDTLRSLTSEEGNHSLFGAHGIISASARPERFLLWPMGIRSPGAMRQWHRHAIAFVGRRHFDDAHLLDTLFERVDAP